VIYIHDKGIVHRDIKPGKVNFWNIVENIMLEDANNLSSIKLIDFGLSVKYDETSFSNMLNDRWGTVIFMAPEILLHKDYNKSVDMWSIGILMYMLISGGRHPFYKTGMSLEQYWDVLKKWPKVNFDNEKFSKISQDLITKFLQFETIHRYSVYQALKHPWITRWNESSIPETFDQVIKNLEIEDKLRYSMKLWYALSVIKNQTVKIDNSNQQYVQLLGKVTNVIEKWLKTKQKTDFVNDEDFVERQGSPTKFDTIPDFSHAFDRWQDDRSQGPLNPNQLTPNISDDEFSPNSDRPNGLLKPIKMTSRNTSDWEENNNRLKFERADENQDTKNSENTNDTTKRANTDFKNSHRIQDSKILVKKSKLQDQNRKTLKNKIKSRIKSPTKKSKIRVEISKEKNKSNMNIKEAMNYSVIDESIISEKLIVPGSRGKGSRAYLSSYKNNETSTSDAIHFHDGYKRRNNVISDKNAFNFNDYSEANIISGAKPGPIL
jgi:hypothetical protein